ncbi:MAG: tetratricopeptide repeat protein [Planctomycetota bacterium]
MRARAYVEAEQVQAAIETLLRALERRHPASVPMRLALADLLGQVGDHRSQEQCLRVVRDLRPGKDADRRLARALVARVAGMVDRESAKDYAPLVDEAARLAPDLPELGWLRGRVLWDAQRFDEALAQVRSSAAALPEHAQVQRDLLGLLRTTGYRELLLATPSTKEDEGLDEAARIERERLREQHHERAYALFREFLDRCPEELAAEEEAVRELVRRQFERLAEQARAALLQDRPKDAVRLFENALLLWTDDAPTRFNLGLAWFVQGVADDEAYRRALAEFDRARRDAEAAAVDPAPMVLYEARCLAATGDPDKARALLRRYVEGEARERVKDERYLGQMREELAKLSR